MLKAKLDSVRKNKKGFSLIELIIVVAIMVALIAVLAPSYVKYVQKSRDSALATAAEDMATAVKTFYADPDCFCSPAGGSTIKLSTQTGKLVITTSNVKGWADSSGVQGIKNLSGIEENKSMGKASYDYVLTIGTNGQCTISTAAVSK